MFQDALRLAVREKPPNAKGLYQEQGGSLGISRDGREGVRKQGMSKKTIENNLRRVLFDDEPFAWALYEYELEEHIEEYMRSKRTDGDAYFFAVTEHTNDVAMLLIDEVDKIHVNEKARALLKKLWRDAYRGNLQVLIPQMADELNAGRLFVAGVKVSAGTGRRNKIRN